MERIEADLARRRIALYREYLAPGAPGEMAIIYLAEIAKLEAALAEGTQAEKAANGRGSPAR